MKKILLLLSLTLALLSCTDRTEYMKDFVIYHNWKSSSPAKYRSYYKSERLFQRINSYLDDIEFKLALSNSSMLVTESGGLGDILYKVDFEEQKVVSFQRYIPEHRVIKVSDSHIQVVFSDKRLSPYFNHLTVKFKLKTTEGKDVTFGFFGKKMESETLFDFNIDEMSEHLKGRVDHFESFEVSYLFYSEEDRSMEMDHNFGGFMVD